MTHTPKSAGAIMVLLSLLLLAACSSPPPTATSTPDLNPVRTEVAATVFAQVTQALALTPSATQIPTPMPTTAPTSTPLQESTLAPSATATPATGTPGTATDDQAKWVSQTIADGTSFTPGETFTMTWRIQNVGTSTWTPAYLLRFYSGDAFGAPKEIQIGKEVKPEETLDLTLQMKAPTKPGDYRSDWVLANQFRSNFKEPVFLKITVALPATATATSTPQTPTVTPTITPTPTQ